MPTPEVSKSWLLFKIDSCCGDESHRRPLPLYIRFEVLLFLMHITTPRDDRGLTLLDCSKFGIPAKLRKLPFADLGDDAGASLRVLNCSFQKVKWTCWFPPGGFRRWFAFRRFLVGLSRLKFRVLQAPFLSNVTK